MGLPEIELRLLRVEDETTFRAAVAEYATFDGVDVDGAFVFREERSGDFPAYVQLLRDWVEGESLPEDFVPNTFLFAFVDGEIVGRISIRHTFNDFLERIGGHIGYAVLPSWHGQGIATEILRQALERCRGLGLERVLLTCDSDNHASRRVIEKNGGVFEAMIEDPELRVPKERYWIAIG